MSKVWRFSTCRMFPVSSEKSISESLVTSLDILLIYVTKRNKFSSNPRKLKAHMLQVGAVYA